MFLPFLLVALLAATGHTMWAIVALAASVYLTDRWLQTLSYAVHQLATAFATHRHVEPGEEES